MKGPNTVTVRKRTIVISDEMALQIKALLAEGELKQHEIAAKFGINQGRVSEINTGKRFSHLVMAQQTRLI